MGVEHAQGSCTTHLYLVNIGVVGHGSEVRKGYGLAMRRREKGEVYSGIPTQSWVCVEQSSFITIFFYDFSVFDFYVCMIFLGLCSCVFCHFGILDSFFFVCFCVVCVFKFEFVFGSGLVLDLFLCSLYSYCF